MCRIGRTSRGGYLSVVVWLAIAFAVTPIDSVQAQPNSEMAVELRAGVIIDLDRALVYLMKPDNAIDAVHIDSGTIAWRSNEAAKPLALSGETLIAQTAEAASGQLDMVYLDVTEAGASAELTSVPLPENVAPTVDATQTGEFAISGRADAGNVDFDWQFYPSDYVTALPGDSVPGEGQSAPTAARGAAATDVGRVETSGRFRLNLSSNAVSGIPTPAAADPQITDRLTRRNVVIMSESDRVPDLPGVQFLSVDGRHVLVSQRIDDDNVFEKYRWQFYSLEQEQVIGELRNHRAITPFYITNNIVLFEEGASTTVTEQEVSEQPLRIRAIDLSSTEELWAASIRDTRYQGPIPQ